MQDLFGSVRRSLVFRPGAAGDDGSGGTAAGTISERIGSCIRKSRAGFGLGLGLGSRLSPSPSPRAIPESDAPPIRWRKGELIGCGAFGHVYMGMNLDSGELLAVKQVLIGTSNASREKAQAHIKELEEEVKLLKNLSHLNIVRYLGTAREEDTLNILLEFVPGGSISSLLGKFGSFPEAVIRMYTKQLLQGLEYLHRNKIMHRDIKGANILVDNKGCIKLADFGASKQVARLATITAAKSMKGTPYWMAPEVIVQSGHSFSADIWSVGCTVIEMATGKPPWSQQYQEVAALFHVGTTKSHPPIPEHLSFEAKDFLLKCLQQEPELRPTAADLLQHPFVTGERQDSHPLYQSSVAKPSTSVLPTAMSSKNLPSTSCGSSNDVDYGSGSCSTMYSEKLFISRPIWEMSTDDDMCRFDDKDDMCRLDDKDDMCRLDDKDHFPVVGSSFNPMSEPFDNWPCEFNASPEQRTDSREFGKSGNGGASSSGKGEDDFTFPCKPMADDDDEVTETKIIAFLDEKAIDLKKLQTPLYEEFYNSLNASSSPVLGNALKENAKAINNSKLPPKSKQSPSKVVSGTSSPHIDNANSTSPGNSSRRVSCSGTENNRVLREILSPRLNEWGELIQESQQETISPRMSFSERQRKWKEELDQELARKREMVRQAGVGGKSPNDRLNQKRDRSRFNSPAK